MDLKWEDSRYVGQTSPQVAQAGKPTGLRCGGVVGHRLENEMESLRSLMPEARDKGTGKGVT